MLAVIVVSDLFSFFFLSYLTITKVKDANTQSYEPWQLQPMATFIPVHKHRATVCTYVFFK